MTTHQFPTKTELIELLPYLTAPERAALNRLLAPVSSASYFQYQNRPVEYASEILNVRWWEKQQEIARLCLEPPYRVLVPSAHGCGKSFTGAGLISWWYDTRDPGVVLTTAPTRREVEDLLWSEVRLQRLAAGLKGFRGMKAPELWSSPEHYAKGFTAQKGESFQGRHHKRMLFLMDEAIGVDSIFWETTRSMFAATGEHAWVCFFNPTDTSSQAYQEWLTAGDGYPERGWHVVQMAAKDHPNIALELAGRPPLIPGAVRLAQLHDWVKQWTTPINREDAIATLDFEWPPGSEQWYRPGPLFEARAAGMWPSQATYSVWSNWLWNACEKSVGEILKNSIPEIGCDMARFGDDFTDIHIQDGGVSIHHETHNGWSLDQTAGRLKQLCKQMVELCIKKNPDFCTGLTPQEIPCKIDVDGMGAGVVDMGDGYNFIGLSGSMVLDGDYKNLRSQLWFSTANQAKDGLVHLARLPDDMLALLRQQAVSPVYKINVKGQLELEPKEKTKERLKRSPDSMDAMNLAYFPGQTFEAPPLVDDPTEEEKLHDRNERDRERETRVRQMFR